MVFWTVKALLVRSGVAEATAVGRAPGWILIGKGKYWIASDDRHQARRNKVERRPTCRTRIIRCCIWALECTRMRSQTSNPKWISGRRQHNKLSHVYILFSLVFSTLHNLFHVFPLPISRKYPTSHAFLSSGIMLLLQFIILRALAFLHVRPFLAHVRILAQALIIISMFIRSYLCHESDENWLEVSFFHAAKLHAKILGAMTCMIPAFDPSHLNF